MPATTAAWRLDGNRGTESTVRVFRLSVRPHNFTFRPGWLLSMPYQLCKRTRILSAGENFDSAGGQHHGHLFDPRIGVVPLYGAACNTKYNCVECGRDRRAGPNMHTTLCSAGSTF